MLRLQDLLNAKKIVSKGFPAFAGIGDYSKGNEEVLLSSISPAVLANKGITEYYALEMKRDTVFNTTEDIINANPPVHKYQISVVDQSDALGCTNTIIVSRHQGTVDFLKQWDKWKHAKVFAEVSAKDVRGKHVVGTLPPHLIKECDMYTAVTIKDFDPTKEGDLFGKELEERINIAKKPIKVTSLEK